VSNLSQSEIQFLVNLQDAGIEVPTIHGTRSVIAAYDNVRGTNLEKVLASLVCSFAGGKSFYSTGCWKRARYFAIAQHGNKCQCCGASPATGAVLHVDHIKPKSKFPELALSIDNLQVLCADCNIGKSNLDETDWRGV